MENKRTINITTKRLSELSPADYNPRKISLLAKRGLRNSIQTFGYVDPIIWNKRTGNIISGHQRYAALVDMHGHDYEIDVNAIDVDEQTEKAMNIALNNSEIQGVFDSESLEVLLNDIIEFPEFIDLNFDLIDISKQKGSDVGAIRKDPILYPNWIVIRYDDTPRTSEYLKGTGAQVLDDGLRIIAPETGEDVTDYHVRGAEYVLEIARIVEANVAYLKGGSPSCDREGVTGEVLKRGGVKVVRVG